MRDPAWSYSSPGSEFALLLGLEPVARALGTHFLFSHYHTTDCASTNLIFPGSVLFGFGVLQIKATGLHVPGTQTIIELIALGCSVGFGLMYFWFVLRQGFTV